MKKKKKRERTSVTFNTYLSYILTDIAHDSDILAMYAVVNIETSVSTLVQACFRSPTVNVVK